MPRKKTPPQRIEFIIAGCGLIALLAAEWALISLVPGTNYSQPDGKMAQAVILTAVRYGGMGNLTNINPLQGLGSQLLPLNVWANPAYWPFAFFDTLLALDISAVVALGCLAFGCYVMARCFDIPILPSIMAAQAVIILFGPLVRLLLFYQVFWINPGTVVVYAAPLMALGAFSRLQENRIDSFIVVTFVMFALFLYSLSCDPLWTMINGIGLLAAFAVVTLSPLRVRPILIRCAALGCCFLLLLVSGVIEYIYTLSRYTARVAFSDVLFYKPQRAITSIVLNFPEYTVPHYVFCVGGWLLGLVFASGRVRILVIAAVASFGLLLAYDTAFLQSSRWWLPIPIYVEHSLFPIFTIAAIGGYWGTLQPIVNLTSAVLHKVRGRITSVKLEKASMPAAGPRMSYRSLAACLAALPIAVAVPAVATMYGKRESRTARTFYVPHPDEPDFMGYLESRIGLRVGGEFRGSTIFVTPGDPSIVSLWTRGVPTINEYSQLVTPQSFYLSSAFFNVDMSTEATAFNKFLPWITPYGSHDVLYKTLQALGARYIALYKKSDEAADFPFITFARRPPQDDHGSWFVYELPKPNIGDYSPFEIAVASSGDEIGKQIQAADFDFTRKAVLSARPRETLVPARNMRLSVIRGGWHVSGHSNATSLVVLPLQYSHCLRARDPRVRLVRANLLMTGLLFSGEIDTDIVFDYGLFSPRCRYADIADVKRLQMKIERK
jgi:hypothetical protein